MKTVIIGSIYSLPLLLAPAAAQQDNWENTPLEQREEKLCISISQIDQTDVLDDYNIVFDMRGKSLFLNRLPNRCPSLKFEDTFTYATSTSQLCNVDIITVLRSTGGTFFRGPSCGLGKFVPVTAEEVKELKANIKQAKKEKRDAKKNKGE